MTPVTASVTSEIGTLEAVILHAPGPEVENMTPENAERALYSDILNLSEVKKEYDQFHRTLALQCQVLFVKDLLTDVLADETVCRSLLSDIFRFEAVDERMDDLMALAPADLAAGLIEGVVMKKDTLTRFFDSERYSLRPLHNFFFTRDAATCINDQVLINRMAKPVRQRESLIMECILTHHPRISARILNPMRLKRMPPGLTSEGGDLLVVSDDVLLAGVSVRTSSLGIDYILDHFKQSGQTQHIIVQELPDAPESFIHLDMVFTILDRGSCLIYEPVIREASPFRTLHITVENGRTRIRTAKDILSALAGLGIHLDPVLCGGNNDIWIQKREQWHSGTNFFALAPGQLVGYGRNEYTIEALSSAGYAILPAADVIDKKINPADYDKYVITIFGTELARGGGGARCMTMPLRRRPLKA